MKIKLYRKADVRRRDWEVWGRSQRFCQKKEQQWQWLRKCSDNSWPDRRFFFSPLLPVWERCTIDNCFRRTLGASRTSRVHSCRLLPNSRDGCFIYFFKTFVRIGWRFPARAFIAREMRYSPFIDEVSRIMRSDTLLLWRIHEILAFIQRVKRDTRLLFKKNI